MLHGEQNAQTGRRRKRIDAGDYATGRMVIQKDQELTNEQKVLWKRIDRGACRDVLTVPKMRGFKLRRRSEHSESWGGLFVQSQRRIKMS
jgi:hypothetical protein